MLALVIANVTVAVVYPALLPAPDGAQGVGNSTENVFDLSTDRILSHEAKDGARVFLPVRDLDFENLDRPVAERITSGFRNSP
jgi:hypothetical protein